ncbi:MAG: 16S rRNA (adenine(1518)-N(6)/adenine(1519)-N(6))-dimethyltransferase RsmA [Clostridia bacterium]
MIKEVLNNHNFKFNKQFGQNFITDTNLLDAIACDAKLSCDDTCLEIGAGAGTLTNVLAGKCKRVISYEIDRNLKPILLETVTCPNVEFEFLDIMKQPISALDQKIGCPYRVVANLPYYLTSPLITSFIEQSKLAKSLTVMVQQEVADRLTAINDTKQYGALTVCVQSVADVSLTRRVSRNMFFPSPNVDSAVVNITINRDKFSILDLQLFKKVYKSAFAMRRKTLENNLALSFKLSKDICQQLFVKLGLNPLVRGEVLSIAQLVELSNLIFKL